MEFDATYYDGRSSARTPVRVRRMGDSLRIAAGSNFDSPLLEVPLAAVRPDVQVGAARRFLRLPGGAQLQTGDHAAVDALFPEGARLEGRVAGLERRLGTVLAAVALVVAFAVWCIVYGVPLGARLAASAVPVRVEMKLGEYALAEIDRRFCRPSGLAAPKLAPAQRQFERVTARLDGGFEYRLVFRNCPLLGANAFALPGGTVVVTDGLASRLRDEGQLAAVLAHEVGHVYHRHGLRLALQGAGVAALLAALTGDVATVTGLAVTLPATLMRRGYSRGFEEEADDYALERLRELGIPGERLGDALTELAGGRVNERPGVLDYLSTHPPAAKRVQRAAGR